MTELRFNQIPATANSAAQDDYIPMDGNSFGTRKIQPANFNVASSVSSSYSATTDFAVFAANAQSYSASAAITETGLSASLTAISSELTLVSSSTAQLSGSLFGTASFSISASWAPNSGGGSTTGSFTGSFTGTVIGTASFSTNAQTYSASLSATNATTSASLNSTSASFSVTTAANSASIVSTSASFSSTTTANSSSIVSLSSTVTTNSASFSTSITANSASIVATSASFSNTISAISGSSNTALSASVNAVSSSLLAVSSSFVSVFAQNLTSSQQIQARQNLGLFINRPEDFGAKGDGVTNDSVAIQNTINTLWALGGGVLQFSAKVYICSGLTIPSGSTTAAITLQGVPFAALAQSATTTATSSINTVLQLPSSGGVILTINGSGTPSQVFYTKLQYLLFKGQPNAASDGHVSIGLKVGGYSQWTEVDHCTFQFFGQQGFQMGGIAYEMSYCYTDYNLRAQPQPRYSAGAEFFGTDGMIDHCEFSGQVSVETAMVDPTKLYTNAMLVQTTNCFFEDIVCEAGDVGLLLLGTVNATSSVGNFDYPRQCTSNHFNKVRPSNNWGNGIVALSLNGSSCQNNVFENCWGATNGVDTTSIRASLINSISSSVSDAAFVIQGQQNVLANCSSVVNSNVNYGYAIIDTSSGAGSFNVVENFKAPVGAYILGVGTNNAAATGTAGTICDNFDTAVVAIAPPLSGALDTTNSSTTVILDTVQSTITSLTTTDNQGTQWTSGSNYTSGFVVSNLGIGYMSKNQITGSGVAPASDVTNWQSLPVYPKFGQRLRLLSQHGRTAISSSTAAVQWSNGRARNFVYPWQSADLQQIKGNWYEVGGTPALSVVSPSQTFGSVQTGSSTSFQVTVPGALVGGLVSIGPNQPLSGCTKDGYVISSSTVLVTLTNNTTASVSPVNGTFNIEVKYW